MSAAHPAASQPQAHGHAEEHAHPTARTYIIVGVILAVITGLEIWVYGVEQLKAFLAPILIVMSATKFVLVVGFYMHLKFDDRYFRYMFGFGLFIAASVIIVLMLLFSYYALPPQPGPTLHAEPAH